MKIPSYVKRFAKPQMPHGMKRDFTSDETRVLRIVFGRLFSWSPIDLDGHIVLGGGEEASGIYYITEQQFEKLMEAYTG